MRQEVWLTPGNSILQDDEYFKLSQDSVLLAAFARPGAGWHGVDLCCGVGPLGALVKLKYGACCDGIELQPGAADLARENFRRVGLETEIHCLDLRQLPGSLADRYRFCICNPPYYGTDRGKVSPKESLALARSEGGCDIDDVCKAASRLLRTGAPLYICYKPERLAGLMAACRDSGLEPKRLRLVHHRPGKPAVLVLLEARKGSGQWLEIEPPLLVEDETGAKTAEWKTIYGIEE